ncbi:MAG: iron-containing alcohol dehydrogenase [Bosea sp.]|jgi:4-hydroxybutyrate dehydrogenase|nr:iron-containing alcohol dehydrogenase [Bosea sp. (in: a-proteobacteria)]
MAIISYLTTIRFDFGAIAGLPEDMAAAGISRPLLVTDKGVVAAGLAARVLEFMPGAAVFDGTPANPTEEAVMQALAAYREHGCDGIVALGGGSPLDLAKGVALLATHAAPLRQYALILGGLKLMKPEGAPMIAIPTTAGTGSEVGRGAVISFADGRKLVIVGPAMMPRRAICDPELTLGLPPLLTAATGMDALTHCIECFISPLENPPAAAIALDGAVRAVANLPRAVANGQDRQARWEMLMASMMGAMAFQKGLGAVHAMSHALGGLKQVSLHHGTLNAVLLPAVLRFNRPVVGDKYERLASAFGLPEGTRLDAFIAGLSASLGLPASLSAMGVKRDWFEAVAGNALADHTTATNARPVTLADYRALLDESF